MYNANFYLFTLFWVTSLNYTSYIAKNVIILKGNLSWPKAYFGNMLVSWYIFIYSFINIISLAQAVQKLF